MVRFFVPGTPIAQPRPKVTTRGRHAMAYVPAKHPVHAWRDSIKTMGTLQGTYLVGPLRLSLVFWMPRPKGHYGTGRNARKVKRSAPVLPAKKPDIDNASKAVMDALDGVLWKDDSQVVQLTASKLYADATHPPGVAISIEQAGLEMEGAA